MRKSLFCSMMTLIVAGGLFGCEPSKKSDATNAGITKSANDEMARMYKQDKDLEAFVDNAYGYAIFPIVAKGGVILGGSYAWGEVYELGERVGHADLVQGTIGLQLGGQTATELILFENKESLDKFKAQKVQLAANATAVLLAQGATATTKHEYKDGIAIFLSPKGGLMFEAAVGGQSFFYKAIEGVEAPTTRPTTKPTAKPAK